MKYTIAFIVFVLMTGCTLKPVTYQRTKRHVNLVHDVSDDILRIGRDTFMVDTLADKALRRKLKRLHAAYGEVFYCDHHEFGADSLIILERHNFFLTRGEIVIDFKNERNTDLAGNGGLIKIDRRVYFRKKTLAISKRTTTTGTPGGKW